MEIAERLGNYAATGNESDLKIPAEDLAMTVTPHYGSAALGKLAADSETANKAWNSAIDSKNSAEEKRLLASQKTTFKSMIDLCRGVDSGTPISTYESYLSTFDNGIVKPQNPLVTSSTTPKAIVLTPVGTVLKVGDAATLEFANGGETGKFKYTVTAIDQASASDLTEFNSDDLKKIGRVFLVRAEVQPEYTDITTDIDKYPAVDYIDPQYLATSSDGSAASQLITFGSVKACGNEPGAADKPRKLCALIGTTSKTAAITEVGLRSLTPEGTLPDTALYSWKK
ncbi:hypothetical protein HH308_21860 [Gordonia sp. TBRC 11910]|uniref:Uncharacterized protein n=1 Tax=Gordonia asplenii TaxID=2725283 RepID=A0A848L5E9_9ACTN|nr:hypothetical protein [Gordonia asplenii]NMO03863.1 hypothetical protein [Gordonia asplenii]